MSRLADRPSRRGRRTRRRRASRLLVPAVLLALCSGCVAVSVSGNQLRGVNHAPLRLLGVNRSGTEYACVQGWGIFDGPSDSTSINAIASWHANAVRVPLNEDYWLAINGVNPAYSGANYQNAVVNYVNALNNAGMVAILDLHWNAPGTQQATGQKVMADADHSPAFWTSVANTFKSNAGVMFDLYWAVSVGRAICPSGSPTNPLTRPTSSPPASTSTTSAGATTRRAGTPRWRRSRRRYRW